MRQTTVRKGMRGYGEKFADPGKTTPGFSGALGKETPKAIGERRKISAAAADFPVPGAVLEPAE